MAHLAFYQLQIKSILDIHFIELHADNGTLKLEWKNRLVPDFNLLLLSISTLERVLEAARLFNKFLLLNKKAVFEAFLLCRIFNAIKMLIYLNFKSIHNFIFLVFIIRKPSQIEKN